MDKRKPKRIRRYFKKFPVWAVVFVLFGVLLLLAAWDEPIGGAMATGVVLLLWGIGALILWLRRPADAEMDALLNSGMQDLEKRALAATGLSESELVQKNRVIRGPRFWDISGATAGIRKGRDRVVRFTPVGVTIINFTPNQIVSYQCAYDLLTGKPIRESTYEYFYQDVVSVSTRCKSLTWDKAMLDVHGLSASRLKRLLVEGELRFAAAETFVLMTSGGCSVEMVLKDPGLIECAGGGVIPTDDAEETVISVRKLLREKKAHA